MSYLISSTYFLYGGKTLAKDYFEQLRAPVKGFYLFEQSAHSPIFEEPDKVRKIMLADVLVGGKSLADSK